MTLFQRLMARLLAPHIDAALERREADAGGRMKAAIQAALDRQVEAWRRVEADGP